MATKEELAIEIERADKAEFALAEAEEKIAILEKDAVDATLRLEEHRVSREASFNERVDLAVSDAVAKQKEAEAELLAKEKEIADSKEQKFKCCFGGHKEILVAGVAVGSDFKLTDDLKENAKFIQAFKRALELKTICPC